jgi:hypothetical protein
MPEILKLADIYKCISKKSLTFRHLEISKKLLLIRPLKKGDDFTVQFSFPASEKVRVKAAALGWDVKELTGNDTGRYGVEAALKNFKPDLVIHYDHGSVFTLFGVYNDWHESSIDPNNVSILSGMAVSTVSCDSVKGLGPMAIASSVRAYLGYDATMTVEAHHLDIFMEAANAANFALLEGKTFQEAYDAGRAKYTEKFNEQVATNDLEVAAGILHDRDSLKLLGNPHAEGCRYYLV